MRALKGCREPLARRYHLALLDLDGVVYRGADPVPHAAEGIAAAERAGMRMAYTTNNPSRYPATVAEQLRGFGLTLSEGQIVTSAVVAARMLAGRLRPGGKVYVVGAGHLKDEVRRVGLTVVDSAREHPEAVLQSWHPDLTLHELAEASYAIENGADYYVTNRDLTIPREQGIAPGNGAMQLPVIATTGAKPLGSAGKPEPAIYDVARAVVRGGGADAAAGHPEAKDRALPVGDRLDTDIEAANRGGYDSLLVFTGVATAQTVVTARPQWRPTFIATDLRGLNVTHPQPVRAGKGSWRCRAAAASLGSDGLLRVISPRRPGGDGDGLDGLRAACCAAWEAIDHGADPGRIRLPPTVAPLAGRQQS